MAGRPTKYTVEIEEEILERIATGEGLRSICKAEHLPSDFTIRNWVIQDKPPGISSRFAHARALGYDSLAEETVDIADDKSDDPASRRVRVDTRYKLLSKLHPKRYGDRIEIAGDKENPLEINVGSVELLKTRIDSLIARGGTDSDTPKPE